MKRMRTLWLLAAVLLLCIGCADVKEPVAATTSPAAPSATPSAVPTATPVPTEVPTPSPTPEPEGEMGIVRADGVGVLLTLLSRGYEVSVTGEQDGYYRVLIDDTEALVEKRFLRLSSEAPYESWKGYAKSKTEVFETAYLEGDPTAVLKRNTAVVVLDAVGDTLLISWDDMQGYTKAANISKKRLSSGSSNKGDSDSGGGGSSGGDSGGGGGADGGDITLSQKPSRAAVTVRLSIHLEPDPPPAPVFPCFGVIIAEATEAYVAIFHLGDTIKVISENETSYEVLTENGIGTIPRRLVLLLSETPYTEWDGYSDNKAPFYTDYRMHGEGEKLKRNTEIRILDDLGDCYLVMAGDTVGYIKKKQVSEEKYRVPSSSSSDDSSGGNGGGGSSGGGGGEWTEPVL